MKFRALLLSVFVVVMPLSTSVVCAGESQGETFKEWEGHYTSVLRFWVDSNMDSFYETLSAYMKKEYQQELSASWIAEKLRTMYYTPFGEVVVKGLSMTFKPWSHELGEGETVNYRYMGAMMMPGHPKTWYAFKAEETRPITAQYRYVIMTKPAPGSPWHGRFGSVSFDDLLTHAHNAHWFGTFVDIATTWEQYMSDMTVQRGAKYILKFGGQK